MGRISNSNSTGAEDGFSKASVGAFSWWAAERKRPQIVAPIALGMNWKSPRPGITTENVNLDAWFNDPVTAIFAPGKYLSPRYAGVSLAIPSQGAGAWAGHLTTLPDIDDSGLRKLAADHDGKLIMPNGISFVTPTKSGVRNIAFTSKWDNYPPSLTVPLEGRARHIYLLMAGSTNFMQSRIDNGEVVVTYSDGTSARLALRNPDTWWPIEQDYFIDDFQFPMGGPLPPRVNLRTGEIRILDIKTFKGRGREVSGGAATVLHLALNPTKVLQSLTVRTLTNDVVIGLMSATLERP
jgi:hypothetical protein